MNDEELFLTAFINKARRERLAELLANPKRRRQATSALAHFHELDPRWLVEIPHHQQSATSIERLLRSKGAPDTCHLISESSDLDGRSLPLASALERVVGQGMGTLISCIPGKLGFFEGEGPSDRYILERRAI